MTFATLRALHRIIGEAIDDIERTYVQHSTHLAEHDLRADSTTPISSPNTSSGLGAPFLYKSSSKSRSLHKSKSFAFGVARVATRGYDSPPSSPFEPRATSPPPVPSLPLLEKPGIQQPEQSLPTPTSPWFTESVWNVPPSPSLGRSAHSPSASVHSLPGQSYPATPKTPRTPYNRFRHPSEPPLVLDFPLLDKPSDPTSLPETLNSTDPVVVSAINRIVSAAGQLSATVQNPFLTICDAIMCYHLPACMRLLEATHTVEILRDAGPDGLHVDNIADRNGVNTTRLAHVLRLLATHHILNEVRPDVFALNRISSLIDSGKDPDMLRLGMESPVQKYENTNGIAAFVGLCTDELFKSSAYLTEAYHLSSQTKHSREPVHTPFNFAFATKLGFFMWLEGEDTDLTSKNELGAELGSGSRTATMICGGKSEDVSARAPGAHGKVEQDLRTATSANLEAIKRQAANRFRLERFGKAMVGTESWEVPGAILLGFDWASLPPGSTIVDVGGGIGSTSMLLANAFANSDEDGFGVDLGFRFIIQDRPVVVEMGEKAWRAQCPELLESGTATFQVHDFFTPQPIRNAAVYLLRVVLHDWPDDFARRILLQLREAAGEETKLVIADFVLPLACVDDFGCKSDTGSEGEDGRSKLAVIDSRMESVEGAQRTLAPAPLLANLGKASANAYWMDLTMQVTFNSQERTLREIVALTSSAGWKVVKVTHAVGSLFGHIVATPAPIPVQRGTRPDGETGPPCSTGAEAGPATGDSAFVGRKGLGSGKIPEKNVAMEVGSRCGTPTFGARMVLPSKDEARFGARRTGTGRPLGNSGVGFGRSIPKPAQSSSMLRHPAVLAQSTAPDSGKLKKRPSPLSVLPPPTSPRPLPSPRQAQPLILSRRASLAQLARQTPSQSQATSPVPVTPKVVSSTPPRPRSSTLVNRQPTPATLTRRTPPSPVVHRQAPPSPVVSRNPPMTPATTSRQLQSPSPPMLSRHLQPPMRRRLSYATLTQDVTRKRVESIVSAGTGSGTSMGSSDKEEGGRIGSSGGSILAAAARIERSLSSRLS